MKPALLTSLLLVFNILTSCNSTDKKPVSQSILVTKKDTPFVKVSMVETQQTNPYDSIANAKVDTSILKGKREFIMNQFLMEQSPSAPDYDTLRDLNFDGLKDYVIGYYGQAGTGIKNRVKVYFYNKKHNCYILNEVLSDLPNPTFYINQKKITGFYIGNGGGGGGRLEWLSGKWTTTKEFHVHNEESKTVWEINYPLIKKKKKLVRPFQMIPPEDILETDVGF